MSSVVEEYGRMSNKELTEVIKSLPEVRDKEKYVPIRLDEIADTEI